QRFPQARLEVQVIRGGRTTLGAVIDYEIAGQSGSKFDHTSQLSGDTLGAVLSVSYRHMMRNDWERVAVDLEVPTKLQLFLLRKKTSRAEEAGALRDGFGINRGGRAAHAMGNMAD